MIVFTHHILLVYVASSFCDFSTLSVAKWVQSGIGPILTSVLTDKLSQYAIGTRRMFMDLSISYLYFYFDSFSPVLAILICTSFLILFPQSRTFCSPYVFPLFTPVSLIVSRFVPRVSISVFPLYLIF